MSGRVSIVAVIVDTLLARVVAGTYRPGGALPAEASLAEDLQVSRLTVREAIKRPDANPPLKELMEKGVHPYGMQTFEMHLRALVQAGQLDKDVARAAATF